MHEHEQEREILPEADLDDETLVYRLVRQADSSRQRRPCPGRSA